MLNFTFSSKMRHLTNYLKLEKTGEYLFNVSLRQINFLLTYNGLMRLKRKNLNISAFQRLTYPNMSRVIQRSDGIFNLGALCFIRDFLSEKQTFEKREICF